MYVNILDQNDIEGVQAISQLTLVLPLISVISICIERKKKFVGNQLKYKRNIIIILKLTIVEWWSF